MQTVRTVAETLVMVDVAVGAGVKDLGIYRRKPPEPEPELDHAEADHHGGGAPHAPEVR